MSTTTVSVAEAGLLTKPSPYALELEPGTYYYCQCGNLSRGVTGRIKYFDLIKGTGLKPLKVDISEKKTYYMCGCRQSDSLPFCDGTHRKEKGVKKYNEFLLKSNTELKKSMKSLEDTVFYGKVGIASSVVVLLALFFVRK